MGTSDYEILARYVKEYSIPEEHQFSLLNRIRIATAMRNPQRRRQLLMIRILAIAVMSHVLPETVVTDKFFAFEPEIIQSLADLIHPDHKMPFVSYDCSLFPPFLLYIYQSAN
jgi:E3 ubiquitin-protein ligase HUWE1